MDTCAAEAGLRRVDKLVELHTIKSCVLQISILGLGTYHVMISSGCFVHTRDDCE